MALNIMSKYDSGKRWLDLLPDEILIALINVERTLEPLWRGNICIPNRELLLMPFTMISPDKVKLVLLCKEPYASKHMCTGIPIEVGNGMQTQSSKAFRNVICKYYTDVDEHRFMDLYFDAGILVLNASFTTQQSHSRYELNSSHFPLWSTFTKPLLHYFNNIQLPMLLLGVEGKKLARDIVPSNVNIHRCSFPKDSKTTEEFHRTLTQLIEIYIFNVNEKI